MIRNLRLQAAQLGLPFGDRTRTFNSRLAQELGLWAESLGQGENFHHAAFSIYFADGKNLAHRKVLLELAERVGLPLLEAQKVIDTRSFAEAVDRDWNDSRSKGITAVPTFVMGPHTLVGAQPYETFVELMHQCAIMKR